MEPIDRSTKSVKTRLFVEHALKRIERKTLDNFSLSKVSRFYETGVKSYIGEQLIEFGFPVDAIKRIEDNNLRLLSMDASASQKYILEHLEDIKQLLDSYERGLLDKALKSICS